MSDEAQFRKEVQDRKKEYQGKKVELISRLCADEANDKRNKAVNQPKKIINK